MCSIHHRVAVALMWMPLINVKLSTFSCLLVNRVSSFMKCLLNSVPVFLYAFNTDLYTFFVLLNINPFILKHLSLSPNFQIMYQYFGGLCEVIFLLIIFRSIALWNLRSITAIPWYSEFRISWWIIYFLWWTYLF